MLDIVHYYIICSVFTVYLLRIKLDPYASPLYDASPTKDMQDFVMILSVVPLYIYTIYLCILYIYISLLYRVNRSTLLSFLIKSETGAYNITRACPRGVPDTLAPTNGAETVIMHKKYSTFLTRIQNSTIDILKRIYFQIFQ